jgi:hypothetical protein
MQSRSCGEHTSCEKGRGREGTSSCLDEFVVLVLGRNALPRGLWTWGQGVVVQAEHLIFLLDKLIGLANLVVLDGL